jgi:hypothetical protein
MSTAMGAVVMGAVVMGAGMGAAARRTEGDLA